jgi:hypothetical protein
MIEPEQLLRYIEEPGTLNAGSIAGLEEIVRKYPYFQVGQLLYALNLFRENHPDSNAQQKKAAVYASDRRKFKFLIDGLKKQTAGPFPSTRSDQTAPAGIPVNPVRDDDNEDFPEETSRDELLDVVHRRLVEIRFEQTEEVVSGRPAGHHFSKEELIERFIREEPKITRPKSGFFNPSESALRSNTDDEEIISETLAILFCKQGNQEKALAIYKKLFLHFPGKSSYFAAQIEKIKNGLLPDPNQA